MQKVEGSSPFSRSQESPAQAGFFDARIRVGNPDLKIGHQDWASEASGNWVLRLVCIRPRSEDLCDRNIGARETLKMPTGPRRSPSIGAESRAIQNVAICRYLSEDVPRCP